MELVQELFVTAFVAIIFSFVVAKLVSIATSTDCESDLGLKSSDESAPPETTVVEAVSFETGLRVESTKSKKRNVKFVEQVVEKVDQFEVKRFDSDVLGRPEKLPEIEIGSVKDIKIDDIIVDDDSVEVRDVMERGQNSNLDGLVGETADVEEIDENKIVDNAKNDSVEVRGQNSNLVRIEEELKEEGLIGDEEEDWEGVERSELEEVFAAASKYVASGGKDDRLFKEWGSDVQMKLYGLHKVAVEGPCYESQPLAFKVSARAKWVDSCYV